MCLGNDKEVLLALLKGYVQCGQMRQAEKVFATLKQNLLASTGPSLLVPKSLCHGLIDMYLNSQHVVKANEMKKELNSLGLL